MTMLLHRQIGRFEIREFLGRGAIGDVWLAWDPEREAEIALKVVRIRGTDADVLEAERNGVSLQQQLSRAAPQVAAVYEWGEDKDFFWVAMEYVAGVDLSAILARGALPEYRAVDVALQLCSMLETCHEFSAEIGGRKVFGVVHGDIKPENIRLQDEDRVRMLDFGIAKHLSQTRRFTVNLFGSLPYTPPERLERGTVDRYSDLWAVGIVLYIMVSGNRPFPGDTPEELDRRIRRGEPPLPLPASVPARLKRIIVKSLAALPEQRYPTAADLRADLEAFLGERPLAGETEAAAPEGGPSSGPADLNATRRTDRPLGMPPPPPPPPGTEPRTEATRRTDRAAPHAGEAGSSPLGSAPASPPPGSPGMDATRRTFTPEPTPAGLDLERTLASTSSRPPMSTGLGRWFAVAVLIVLLGAGAIGHGWVRGEAGEIRRALVAENPDLDALSERYRRASRFSILARSDLAATGEDLREALLSSADRVLDSYHGEDPQTSENDWRDASRHLQSAYEIERDRPTRARILYSQGHLDRIAAQELRKQGKNREASQKTDEAIRGFREAARRDPDWPDPYLGLARIYAYLRFDLSELEAAIGQLGRHGYKISRREKAMLGDGYRMQAQNLFNRAVQTRGSDDEAGYLDKTREHLERAIEQYDEIPGFSMVEENRAAAERLLGRVEARLDELEKPDAFHFDIPFLR